MLLSSILLIILAFILNVRIVFLKIIIEIFDFSRGLFVSLQRN